MNIILSIDLLVWFYSSASESNLFKDFQTVINSKRPLKLENKQLEN